MRESATTHINMSLRSEKLLQELFDEVHDAFDYWAEVKIKDIKESHRGLNLKPAEYKALQKLIETKTGREALEKLLINCGESNLHSTFAYIDGCTGIKPLELVNAYTCLPIAEETLHEYFSEYCRESERLNK